ncbi:MAG TPA: hypothetical protein VHA78_03510 [Candidatus Peribacteraceae bacterium]|nr:hypothetical protein [Candidatus Peribacteraceae bacterium]
MPLKHSTETLLVVVLAAVTLLTGVVCAILPPITQTVVPWVIAFAVSLIYPLSLYPLFKERRADYEFRALHFVPALILAAWLILQALASLLPSLQAVLHWYTWGWTLPAVVASFYALIWFCLHVIRQRFERLWTLIPLLIAFVVFSVAGMHYSLPSHMTALLWKPTAQTTSGTTVIAGNQTASSGPSSARSSLEQEVWQMQQRVMLRREARLAHSQGTADLHAAKDGAMIAASGLPQIVASSGSSSSSAPHLPSSGAGTEALLVAAFAVYCAVLHERAKRRMMA